MAAQKMDRATYIKIRNSLNLEKKTSAPLIHALEDVALMVVTWALWNFYQHSVLHFLMIPLLFCILFRGFGIMHDAVHGAVSKKRWINDLAGFIGGTFCILPYENWKRAHLKHHQWSGNVEKDPVVALVINYPKFKKSTQFFLSFFWMLWFPVLGIFQQFVFWNISIRLYLKEPKSLKMFLSIAMPIVAWGVLLFATSTSFVTTILLPTLFLYYLGVEVVNFPHHLQLPQFRGEHKFPVWEQFQIARSCVYPAWFARFVVLNFNFHIEHHMFPDVPWYHLDKLHEPVKTILGDDYNTDPSFGWILKNKKMDLGQVLSPAEKKPAELSAA